MAFPTFPPPQLNDPWTEGGIDYTFDGIRWVPVSTGSGLSTQQLRLFNGLVAWANQQGQLAPPTLVAFTPRSGIIPNLNVVYLVSWSNAGDDFSVTIDWKDGTTEPLVLPVRTNGEWWDQIDPTQAEGGFLEWVHKVPIDMPLGAWKPTILLSNEWGDTGPTEADFAVLKEITDYTFSYSSLMDGLDVPTKTSLSDNNQTTTVFATKTWTEEGSGKPFFQVDFGETVVPDWITMRRAKAIPGTAFTTESYEYWMRQRTLSYGNDDGQGGITWVRDDNFEASISWAIRNNDIVSWRYTSPCRYIRFSMADNFNIESHGMMGISFGDLSFGHVDRTNEPQN